MMIIELIAETVRFVYQRILDFFLQPFLGGLHGKCVFITGCDSGFGNALARKLDSLGVPVFAGCLADTGCKELREVGSSRLRPVQVDVTNSDSIVQARNFVQTNLPPNSVLWGVVNNAGFCYGGVPAEFSTKKNYELTFQVNFFGLTEVCRIFLPLLKKSKGRIVNIASVAGRIGFPDGCVYGSSKFALEGYSDSLRRDLKRWGVSVHLLEPYAYKTPLTDPQKFLSNLRVRYAELADEVRDQYGEDWLEKQVQKSEAFVNDVSNPNIHEVIDTYIHALLAVYPRSRYAVGTAARRMMWKAMLPDYMSDIVFQRGEFPVPNALR